MSSCKTFAILFVLALQPRFTYADVGNTADFWVLTSPEAPFVVQDDKRQLSGMLVDVVNGVLQEAGINQHILAAPWERVEREARVKPNVLVFALARTAERENAYHWITPLTANVFSVHGRNGQKDQFKNLDELAQVPSIAVLNNDVRHKLLLDAKMTNIKPFDSWPQALEAVLSGETEAIFLSDAEVQYFCRMSAKDCNSLQRVFMYERMLSYLVLSKVQTDSDLAKKLKDAANRFKGSEHFSELTQYWLKQYENVPIPMHMEDGVLNLWQQ